MTPRIDAHQHFWRLDRGDYGWLTPAQRPLYRDFEPEDLAPELARRGIAATVLVQAAPTAAETAFLLGLGHGANYVGAVVGWVDLAAGNAALQLAELAKNPLLRGVRPMLQDLPDPDWVLDTRLTPAFEALLELGLRFDALVTPVHLPAIHELLHRYPELPLVIDHGGKPDIASHGFSAWADGMAQLAEDTAAVCKLSGLGNGASVFWKGSDLAPYADHLLRCFGPTRLMWGSNWPVVNLAGGYGRWWDFTQSWIADLDEPARNRILGGTALDFYAIELENAP